MSIEPNVSQSRSRIQIGDLDCCPPRKKVTSFRFIPMSLLYHELDGCLRALSPVDKKEYISSDSDVWVSRCEDII